MLTLFTEAYRGVESTTHLLPVLGVYYGLFVGLVALGLSVVLPIIYTARNTAGWWRMLDRTGKLAEMNGIKFYTSDKMLEEIKCTAKQEQRNLLKLFFRLFLKVPYTEPTIMVGPIGIYPIGALPIGGGYEQDSPLFENLKRLFDADDAEHIFQAVMYKCDYFLTVDYRTILNKADSFHKQRLSDLKIVSPSKLLEALV